MSSVFTDEQQARVTLAKDVIAQLNARRFVATLGSYVMTRGADADRLRSSKRADDAKTVFADLRACEVCAVGALFLATVERHNSVAIRDVSFSADGRHIELFSEVDRAVLHRFFSPDQMALIESAFEGDLYGDEDTVRSAIKFGFAHRDADSRLRAIMANIIANGEFVP